MVGNHLFLAVSTDFTSSAPLVPGSLTYSSLGGGDCATSGAPTNRFDESASICLDGDEGRSSPRRLWNAFVSMRGMNLEREMEEWEETIEGAGSGTGGTLNADVEDGMPWVGDVEGRTVLADRLDLNDVERDNIPGTRSLGGGADEGRVSLRLGALG